MKLKKKQQFEIHKVPEAAVFVEFAKERTVAEVMERYKQNSSGVYFSGREHLHVGETRLELHQRLCDINELTELADTGVTTFRLDVHFEPPDVCYLLFMISIRILRVF